MHHKTALVLFSGGQDSTTCLAHALQSYERVETIAFDYRQRHHVELEARLKVLDEIRHQFPQWAPRVGTANWMAGILSSTLEKFAQADKHLRAAIPSITNGDMLAGAYYHLGYVNYRLAEAGERVRIHDALKFTKLCVGINSAVQYQASENLKSMKAEYAIVE